MDLFVKQSTKLVKGCIANDRAAQEDLYKLFYAEMIRLCYRYFKTDELAKEALNAGFLKVFQHIGSFDYKKGDLHTWIKTIIVRTCIDLNRRELKFATEKWTTEETEDVFILPAALQKLYAEDLVNSIRMLPAATQAVFNLYVIDGYSHKEIGEQLNIGESTSRWHLAEAKKQLRELLSHGAKSNGYPSEKNKITK
ncbi:sigma-70 family RNA polymerase sigma factor [Mucilaginibacter sp. BJC16-A38]|uniref:RNA polymerase sigma factor n=1 Tax=Mucilaginibacter phenanthrenivorans TaxID=1234842 RepID=UPI0021582A1C|nr:sigma-70 family RNA polymerase sigma factor [Mucilaginibacter phenanthrenivorans]MCR8560843.1 sigma-70 family RNA polymerase sigma factor [Mucilaginibacter phenanthrenivorans]